MISVRFTPSSPPLWVFKNTVTFPADQESYRRILDERFANYLYLAYYYAPFVIRHFLSLSEQKIPIPVHTTYLTHHKYKKSMLESVKDLLWNFYESLGVDPIAFALHLMVGESPYDAAFPNTRFRGDSTPVASTKDVGSDGKYNSNFFQNKRLLTPDLIREALVRRPWQDDWGPLGRPYPSAVRAAGHYYPSYYPQNAERPHDLTELYFEFRGGGTDVVGRTADALRESVDAWMRHGDRSSNGLIVPMIGRAPLMELASHFGYPVAFPWAPRPLDYGKGVEGKRTSEKMRLVKAALRLEENPSASDLVAGRSVLLLDDNVTDFVTYMWARKLLLDAGASEVGLVTLTHTIRNPREIPWSTR